MDETILGLIMDVALVFASAILALAGLGLWLRDWALARSAGAAPPSGAWLLAFAFFLGWATPFYAWERRRFRTGRRPRRPFRPPESGRTSGESALKSR